MRICPISFQGIPKNYAKISDTLSRSAQPMEEDFQWLKEQGITDIVNFRTMVVPGVDYDEKTVVENLGMKYHNVPSITRSPKEDNVMMFLDIVDNVEKQGGKTHIHCRAGSDRTGMYAYIYKSLKGIGCRLGNQIEMIRMGHNAKVFPDLLPWTDQLINKILKTK